MRKQEKIQEEWGIHYASDIDSNGYRTYNEFEKSHLGQWEDNWVDKGFNEISKTYWVRPKSLSGIENNNGWFRIESEADLPKEDCSCFVIFDNGEIDVQRYFVNYKDFANTPYKYITHYQVVKIPSPPLY